MAILVRLHGVKEEAAAQWAAGQPFSLTVRAPWADKEVVLPELTEEQKAYIQEQAEKKEAAATAEEVEAKGPTSFFHGKEDADYQVGKYAPTQQQLRWWCQFVWLCGYSNCSKCNAAPCICKLSRQLHQHKRGRARWKGGQLFKSV